MEGNVKCHKCAKSFGDAMVIQCTRTDCNCFFCLFCFKEKYPHHYTKIFEKMKKNNRFKCFKCLNVCTCEDCISKMPNKPGNDFITLLSKKRRRFQKKFRQKKKILPNETKNEGISEIKVIIPILSENDGINIKPQVQAPTSQHDNTFPNYSQNTILNTIILNSATITHAFRIGRPRKKSNKPCILCSKFKCPPGVEIIKYKTYEDYLNFLFTFFSQIENEQKKNEPNNKLNEELYNRIMIQKKNVQQLKDFFKKTISKNDNKLKGPKRFCTNCIANLFREQNGVYSIYESLKDNDEQASLEPKKKLEIIKGLHLLIEKEKENEKNQFIISNNNSASNLMKDSSAFLHKQLNDTSLGGKTTGNSYYDNPFFGDYPSQGVDMKNMYNQDNIFNQILGDGKEGNEKKNYMDMFGMENPNNSNYNFLNEKKGIELTYNCNYNYNFKPKIFFDFKNCIPNYQYPPNKTIANQNDYFIPPFLRKNQYNNTNICMTYLIKIFDYAGETKELLMFMQNKLIEFSYCNNKNLLRDIQSMTEFLTNRTRLLNKTINDYDFVLHNLSE